MKTVYLDYAATTPVLPVAKNEVDKYLDLYYNPSAAYKGARAVRMAVEKARKDIANCIGADPEEIYFTSGATEGNNIAIQGLMKVARGRLITSSTEHHAVLNQIALYPDNNYVLSVGYDGAIDLQDLRAAVAYNDVVSIMMINNENGYIQPINDIIKIVHSTKGYVHTDATQAVGHVDINVHELGVDILTASGHKFGAPKGIGFIYIRKGLNIPSSIYGGGQERGFRSGTENVPYIAAMAAALKFSVKHLEEDYKNISTISKYLIDQLSANFNCYFNIANENHYAGTVNVQFHGIRSEELIEFLSINSIYASAGSACNTNDGEPSHVLTAMGLTPEQADASIRFSIGRETTKEEIDYLIYILKMYYNLRGDVSD